jgi:hypothetical protein
VQRRNIEPAVDGGGARAVFADGLAMLLQFSTVRVLLDGLMRRGLAGEDEVAAGVVGGRNDRLAGEQIITEKDRPKMNGRGAVPGQPALRGVAFAVLLLCPVLRRDKLGRQRQDLLVAGRDQAGTEDGVEVCRAAVGPPPHRALATFDLARAVVLGSVQRDQHPPAKALERRQRPRCLDRLEEQLIKRCRRGTVQYQADIVVGRDRRRTEHCLAVRSAVPFLQPLPCTLQLVRRVTISR